MNQQQQQNMAASIQSRSWAGLTGIFAGAGGYIQADRKLHGQSFCDPGNCLRSLLLIPYHPSPIIPLDGGHAALGLTSQEWFEPATNNATTNEVGGVQQVIMTFYHFLLFLLANISTFLQEIIQSPMVWGVSSVCALLVSVLLWHTATSTISTARSKGKRVLRLYATLCDKLAKQNATLCDLSLDSIAQLTMTRSIFGSTIAELKLQLVTLMGRVGNQCYFIADLKLLLGLAGKTTAQLKFQLVVLMGRLGELSYEMDGLKLLLGLAGKTTTQLKLHLIILMGRLGAQCNQIASLKLLLSFAGKSTAHLKLQLVVLMGRIGEQSYDIDSLKLLLRGSRQTIAQLRLQLVMIMAHAGNQAQQIDDQGQHIDDQAQHINDLYFQLQEAADEIERLRRECHRLKRAEKFAVFEYLRDQRMKKRELEESAGPAQQ